jgi:hypothetical protein
LTSNCTSDSTRTSIRGALTSIATESCGPRSPP